VDEDGRYDKKVKLQGIDKVGCGIPVDDDQRSDLMPIS
jgi:hypothetical protein